MFSQQNRVVERSSPIVRLCGFKAHFLDIKEKHSCHSGHRDMSLNLVSALVCGFQLVWDQALSLWGGSTDYKTLDYQRTNQRKYQISENSHEGNYLHTRPSITPQPHPV